MEIVRIWFMNGMVCGDKFDFVHKWNMKNNKDLSHLNDLQSKHFIIFEELHFIIFEDQICLRVSVMC